MRVKKQVLFVLSFLLIATMLFAGCGQKPALQQDEAKKDETIQQEKEQTTQQEDDAGDS